MVGFYRVCVIDQFRAHSPADYVRRPPTPTDSPTLGLGHLQFEALLTAAWPSANRNDFALIALIAMLGLIGLRIFEACGANLADLGEEHGHHALKIRAKGDKTVLVPLPPAVARAIEHATERREQGPILRNSLRYLNRRGLPAPGLPGRRNGPSAARLSPYKVYGSDRPHDPQRERNQGRDRFAPWPVDSRQRH
ncbi:hypothetical protein AB0M54_30865 [Actinoplanes sp. NPDC051470]|uniref:hypothetical protein n=1 Tax=Actinoplanes sp. NPDC051470 TaxID=3157224 RepID=UPI003423804D